MEGAKVARPSARCWGRPPRRAARQGPASAALGARGYTFPSPPALVSSRAAAAEISSRGNHADSSRGSSPRPSSPPPPLCWGAGASPRRGGSSGSLGQEVAGGRGAAGYQLALPCDAALRPATPRAPRARARALSRCAPCSCRDTRAHRQRPSQHSIPASAGRQSLPGSSCDSSTAPSWFAPKRSQRSRTSPVRSDLPRCAPPAPRGAQVSPRLGAGARGGKAGLV